MNMIQSSMKEIQASEELKKKTLQYLEEQRKSRHSTRVRYVMRYMIAAVCVFLLLGVGGYASYARPISYISIDVNPSIELGINRFDRVVSVKAYGEDGEDILAQIPLKNIPYLQAINHLLEDERYNRFLTEKSLLVVTVISDHSDLMVEEINTDELVQKYGVLTYTSDLACMEEAHRHEMSFGKYGAYLELSQYDKNITVEECYGMTMREIYNRIESCQSFHDFEGTGTEGSDYKGTGLEGSDNEGTERSDNEGAGTERSDNEGAGTGGRDNEGAGTGGSDNEGAGTKGSDYEGTGIKGSDYDETGTEGSDYGGTGLGGSDNEGAGMKGSDYDETGTEGSNYGGTGLEGSHHGGAGDTHEGHHK